ncbi:MAG: RICIN domain-containing protein [Pseudomonadota bacterium]
MKRLLAGLALALLGTPAMAFPCTDLIEAGNSGTCVAHQGGKAVVARCNGNNPSQRWAFLMNGQIRPANAVGSCLDMRAERFGNGTDVLVCKCNGGRNQTWETGKRSLLKTAKNHCLDVPASRFTAGGQLIIWTCNQKKRNQHFGGHVLGKPTNGQLAAPGFPACAKCLEHSGRTEANGKCCIDFKAPQGKPKGLKRYIRWFDSLRWGFRTGGGGNWDTEPSGHWTLDASQTYSLDRCAHAHEESRSAAQAFAASSGHCVRDRFTVVISAS